MARLQPEAGVEMKKSAMVRPAPGNVLAQECGAGRNWARGHGASRMERVDPMPGPILPAFAQLAFERAFERLSRLGRFERALSLCGKLGRSPGSAQWLGIWGKAPPELLDAALVGPLAGRGAIVASGLGGWDRAGDLRRARALREAGAWPQKEIAERWGLMLRSGALRWGVALDLVKLGWLDPRDIARGHVARAARVALGLVERSGALSGPMARAQARFVLRALEWDSDLTRQECRQVWAASTASEGFDAFWARKAEPAALRAALRGARGSRSGGARRL